MTATFKKNAGDRIHYSKIWGMVLFWVISTKRLEKYLAIDIIKTAWFVCLPFFMFVPEQSGAA